MASLMQNGFTTNCSAWNLNSACPPHIFGYNTYGNSTIPMYVGAGSETIQDDVEAAKCNTSLGDVIGRTGGMKRDNCWEYMACGREPGGRIAELLGPCPAAMHKELDGVNHGDFGGRFCWTLDGTLCSGCGQERIARCLTCVFFKTVLQQEGESFVLGVKKPDDSGLVEAQPLPVT